MDKLVNKILEQKGVKITAMRELVLHKFIESNSAYSLSQLDSSLDWSDKSTIFRTLKTFVDKGILHTIDNGSGSTLYALCSDSCKTHFHVDFHPHFKCDKCGKTMCIDSQTFPEIQVPDGFEIKNVEVNLSGICNDCKLV